MSKIKNQNRVSGQITYIAGLRMSKAVLTNYRKGRYSDETFIKHLVKYNEDRSDMFALGNDKRSYEEKLRAEFKWFDEEYPDSTNEEKAEAVLSGARAISNWKDENDAYLASLETTYDLIDVKVKNAIKKKFGKIDWDTATYDSDTRQVTVQKNGLTLTMSLNAHAAGIYDEDALSWSVK